MLRSPRVALAAVLAFALVVGYFVAGEVLYRAPIGLDPRAFLAGAALTRIRESVAPSLVLLNAGTLWLMISLFAVFLISFVVVRRAVRARVAEANPERRRFLVGSFSGLAAGLGSLALAGGTAFGSAFRGVGRGSPGWWEVFGHLSDRDVVFTHPKLKSEWKHARVQSYRRLGRTEWQVSDIVLGTARIEGDAGERIAREAIERGVNYFDTAPDYARSGSERAMGRAMKGVRDRIFVATKFCTPQGHLPAGSSVAEYKHTVEESLRRLGTDYVDLVHIHSCDQVDRLLDPNVHEAFSRLKQEGKARFLGVSTHTPNLVEVADTAIRDGRFDVMMLAYLHDMWTPTRDIMRRARLEQDMGVAVMKTLKGARHRGLLDFEAYADTYAQAALKWALSNQDVSCAVISFFEPQHVGEYLAASGQPFTSRDQAVLDAYNERIAGSYCGPHCGQCLDSCPAQLPIHDVLRYRMYFEDYGWEKEGLSLYSKLERNAEVCVSCTAPCAGSCPIGVPIQERMTRAHDLLTLA